MFLVHTLILCNSFTDSRAVRSRSNDNSREKYPDLGWYNTKLYFTRQFRLTFCTFDNWSYGGIMELVCSPYPIPICVLWVWWASSVMGHYESNFSLGQRYGRSTTICMLFSGRFGACFSYNFREVVCHGLPNPWYLRYTYWWHWTDTGTVISSCQSSIE